MPQTRSLTLDQLIEQLTAERARLAQHISNPGDLPVYLNDQLPVVAWQGDMMEGFGDYYIGLYDEEHLPRNLVE